MKDVVVQIEPVLFAFKFFTDLKSNDIGETNGENSVNMEQICNFAQTLFGLYFDVEYTFHYFVEIYLHMISTVETPMQLAIFSNHIPESYSDLSLIIAQILAGASIIQVEFEIDDNSVVNIDISDADEERNQSEKRASFTTTMPLLLKSIALNCWFMSHSKIKNLNDVAVCEYVTENLAGFVEIESSKFFSSDPNSISSPESMKEEYRPVNLITNGGQMTQNQVTSTSTGRIREMMAQINIQNLTKSINRLNIKNDL